MGDSDPCIEALGSQGDGILRTAGGEVHIPRMLPGERVQRGASDDWELVPPASPERRQNYLCPHFPRCGGCALQHMSEPLYRSWKSGLLGTALRQRGIAVETQPMLSVPRQSRRRATFGVAWDGGTARLGFHVPRSHAIEPITACAVLDARIVTALPALAELAAALLRPGTGARVGVLATDTGLDIDLVPDSGKAQTADTTTLARLARAARVARLSVDGLPVLMLAAPSVRIAGVAVRPPPGAFLQAAPEAEALIGDLVVAGVGKAKRVADLFAGAGTLSLALARRSRVLAADSEQSLLDALGAAHQGAQGLKPIERLRRDLFRDPLSPQELKAFDAVVLDPPRAGADAQSRALARSGVGRIVMVSCNPATLARDLRTLIDGGYALEEATPIDQFLYSAHLEAVAVLGRRR